MNLKDKDKVIGPGKPNEVSKKPMGVWNQQTGRENPKKAIRPWMPKGKFKGTQEPMSKSKTVPMTGH